MRVLERGDRGLKSVEEFFGRERRQCFRRLRYRGDESTQSAARMRRNHRADDGNPGELARQIVEDQIVAFAQVDRSAGTAGTGAGKCDVAARRALPATEESQRGDRAGSAVASPDGSVRRRAARPSSRYRG